MYYYRIYSFISLTTILSLLLMMTSSTYIPRCNLLVPSSMKLLDPAPALRDFFITSLPFVLITFITINELSFNCTFTEISFLDGLGVTLIIFVDCVLYTRTIRILLYADLLSRSICFRR